MPQSSLPSPRTWSAGDLVTTPRLRADVEDAIAFLSNRPMFIGQNTSGRSWASGSDLGLGLDTEVTDNWNGHVTTTSGSPNSAQYWCQVPGWYLCRSAPAFSYTSSTQAMFAGGLEGLSSGVSFGAWRGPLVLDGSTHPPVPQCIDLVALFNTGPPGGSGDYVQFDAFQNTGSSVNLVSAATQLPTASARWVCALSGTSPLPVPPLAAVPSPITSAWLNANVRDTIKYLIYPPVLRAVYAPNATTLASTAFPGSSSAPLNSLNIDNYGGFNTSTNTYTAPIAGRYLIAGQVNFASNTGAGSYRCGINYNTGNPTQWGDVTTKLSDTTGGGAGVVKRLRLNAGDTIRLAAGQDTGAAVTYNSSSVAQTRLVMVWEGI